ncbi:hypothetical protein pEaSNUABM35_00185 [Erwinia phage pEa_SNUABM_35]|uniref:Uncharacterized protein n=1 Tax=Erwinia phage pEa_SNUABM_35 TaxID=2869557 RepID=A0AAE8C234_9CAUD|nr:hypothetical protein MPK65_gp185 [Erwinia phage pEa_SNUABM_35]QZE60102.1 hypothetical protein pEaSNUABM35_00185 [Erwinia phage pEa_SNUABM_35]QZE60438.1 hypothetical protein pEaSNUABM36_00185 [Erwinia phage pEa_SNUABM_36]
MQYIAAPANSWSDAASPDMFFFDRVKDNVDLLAPTDDRSLGLMLREARTTLGQNRRTMIVSGQKDSVYYLTELARITSGSTVALLAALARQTNRSWSQHSVPNLTGLYGSSNTSFQYITLFPSRLNGSRDASMPMIGVRSAISAARTYAVYVGYSYRTKTDGVASVNALGYYTPPSSPSGGTFAYGENNTLTVTSDYTHASWPTSFSISDTGYGPSIAYTNATTTEARGLRIKSKLVDDETINLSDACLPYSGLLVRLKKGEDYSVEDNCIPSQLYLVDFSLSQKVLML